VVLQESIIRFHKLILQPYRVIASRQYICSLKIKLNANIYFAILYSLDCFYISFVLNYPLFTYNLSNKLLILHILLWKIGTQSPPFFLSFLLIILSYMNIRAIKNLLVCKFSGSGFTSSSSRKKFYQALR